VGEPLGSIAWAWRNLFIVVSPLRWLVLHHPFQHTQRAALRAWTENAGAR
jgi:hypothetical protein